MESTHTPDVDFGTHAHDLEQGDLLRSSVTAQVAEWLPVPAGATVADVGCGTGEMTLRLADRVGPGGRVLAVDRETVLLERVGQRAAAAGLGDRVTTVPAAIDDLPGALPGPVALVWAGHVVHHAGDQAAAVGRLSAALAPGGVLAVAEGAPPPRRLPWDVGVGRPGIETRLEAALGEWFAAMRADLPGSVRDPRGWSSLLRAAGLDGVTSRGWLLHLPAPLSGPRLAAVLQGLAGRVERARPWLAEDDLAAWERLLDENGPDWLGGRDDIELISTEVVYTGVRNPVAAPGYPEHVVRTS
jgi:SAM-dependent methyltransferase